jgi:hypothetical protein
MLFPDVCRCISKSDFDVACASLKMTALGGMCQSASATVEEHAFILKVDHGEVCVEERNLQALKYQDQASYSLASHMV